MTDHRQLLRGLSLLNCAVLLAALVFVPHQPPSGYSTAPVREFANWLGTFQWATIAVMMAVSLLASAALYYIIESVKK